ncbi:MAG: two-component sensor histidine kinase [Bacteroidetes bacterium]|nr:two-component sensor histidine kinase [Bacteroidota bacterium]
MGQTEYKIFIILATLILLVFINGILIFVIQYRKRKLLHEKEKTMMNEQHTEELLQTKLEIQTQTMQDIGREIHDNVGQRLTLAAIYANQLSHSNNYPEITQRITEVGSIINESLSELRNLSRHLTNENTQATELKTLIESECARINALNICTVSCHFNRDNFSMFNTVKNFILRIIQEFIQNSLKHSGCKQITIAFTYTYTGLEVTATDDGKGFDTGNIQREGIGLQNMKKRAELIGAEFSINSQKHNGTQLHLFIPSNKLSI